MIEVEEKKISERINGMTLEEQKAVASELPDSILWNELKTRYARTKARLEVIENTVNV